MPTYTALMHMHRAVKTIQRDIDNIIVDVFKIMCCSEPTDSFMVNVTVAQLSGHSRGKVLQQPGHVPRLPPPPLAPPLSLTLRLHRSTPFIGLLCYANSCLE